MHDPHAPAATPWRSGSCYLIVLSSDSPSTVLTMRRGRSTGVVGLVQSRSSKGWIDGPSPIKNRSMRETFHGAHVGRDLLNYYLLIVIVIRSIRAQ